VKHESNLSESRLDISWLFLYKISVQNCNSRDHYIHKSRRVCLNLDCSFCEQKSMAYVCEATRPLPTPPLLPMGCLPVTDPPEFCKLALAIYRYSFIHLGADGHCESRLSFSKIRWQALELYQLDPESKTTTTRTSRQRKRSPQKTGRRWG